MSANRLLIVAALFPLACVQGSQSVPPPATATTEPAKAAANPAPPPAKAATATPEPVRQGTPEPPAAPVPARVRMHVPAGTHLPIEFQTTVSSDSSREGDVVLAVLTEDVLLDGFKLDKGAEVRGRVVTSIPAKRVKGRARLVIAFEGVMKAHESLSIDTVPIDSMADSTSGKDKKIIGGGAIGGLIVGAIKDGKKGAAIGTVIGAAAGTGAVLIMKGDEVEIPRGAKLSITVR